MREGGIRRFTLPRLDPGHTNAIAELADTEGIQWFTYPKRAPQF
jgi:hypothetical protein